MGEMQALQVWALAPDLAGTRLASLPVPVRATGEVLVRIEAAAVGFPDLLMSQGLYQAKPPLPFVPGMEAAGVVIEAPDNCGFTAGDEVIAGARHGCIAQYGCFDPSALVRKPSRLSMPEAASLRSAYLTAWVALVRRGTARPGEWLLVHGAAGGVGLAAVDLGLALGLKVIAVASRSAKREAIARLYRPHHVIDGTAGFRDQVLGLTGGQGADLVFDPVGGDVFRESTRCIAFDGRLLVIGFASGEQPQIGANIPLIKGFSVVGVRAGEYGRRFPERGAENVASILELAQDGAIRPHVHATHALADWREAFGAIGRRTVVGRSVILPHAN